MGELIPSMPDSRITHANKFSTGQKLAELFLTEKNTRNETLATANSIISVGLSMLDAPRPDLHSYEECVAALSNYFEKCAASNVKPTISAIALSLGTSRKQFLEACETGQVTSHGAPCAIALPNDVWRLFISLRDNYVAMLEGFMESASIHPTAGIFLLKNNGDYKDEVDHNYKVTNVSVDVNALAEKYAQEMKE